jgi:uncharacterized protein YbjT (DUF2867 family)
MVTTSGLTWGLLRCVMFHENHAMNADTIKSQGAFYLPAKGDVPVPGISVNDIGEAAANCLAQWSRMNGSRTFTLSGPACSWNECAGLFSKVLQKPVKFVTVSDQDAIAAMTKKGIPENMARGLCELHHEFERGTRYPTTDLTALTRHEPESFEMWLNAHRQLFV